MRISGGVWRVRSAEECIATSKLNGAAYAVAGLCFAISGVIMGLAWRVLSG